MSQVQDPRAADRAVVDVSTNGNGQAAGHSRASLGERVRALRLQPGASKARPRSSWLPWGLTLIALTTAGLFAYRAYRLAPEAGAVATEQPSGGDNGKTPAASDTNSSTGQPASAAAQPAATGDVVLDSKGYVVAAHEIQLSPQVGGEIVWLDPNFKEGAVYKKGDKLAQVDPVIYAAQLDGAKAALQVAQTNAQQVETGSTLDQIEAAKANLQNLAAKLELSQIDARYFHAAGIAITQHDKDKADAQVRADQAAYLAQKETLAQLETSLQEQRQVTKAQVLSAQANVTQAEKQLNNCTILAPTTGIILTKNAELGGYVNPLAFGGTGSASYLCQMADLKDLEVELDIQERDISRVNTGQHCRIMPEAAQNDAEFAKTHPQGYSGIVSRRLPVANRAKGAITVRVKVDIPEQEQSGQYLLPDMGVLVSFLKG